MVNYCKVKTNSKKTYWLDHGGALDGSGEKSLHFAALNRQELADFVNHDCLNLLLELVGEGEGEGQRNQRLLGLLWAEIVSYW